MLSRQHHSSIRDAFDDEFHSDDNLYTSVQSEKDEKKRDHVSTTQTRRLSSCLGRNLVGYRIKSSAENPMAAW